jgi:hypothetical protein
MSSEKKPDQGQDSDPAKPEHPDRPKPEKGAVIKIDRTEYTVHEKTLTGLQLRALARPPIGPERDLFEVVPGGTDRKIENTTVVKIRDGMRFFTAPAQINPGVGKIERE